MSMLAFFPWLANREAMSAGEFQLVPYKRSAEPEGAGTPLQAALDLVTSPYCLTPSRPVHRAVVITRNDRAISADINDDEITDYFVFSDLLAFAGLASRQYFGQEYCNRDCFRLIIQGFRPHSTSVAITSRRRDGSLTSVHTSGTLIVPKPPHVPYGEPKFDKELLAALLEARDLPAWEAIYEAIVCFNLANSDSLDTSPETEAILMIAAFQRLLSCRGGEVKELNEKLHEVFTTQTVRAPGLCGCKSSDPGVTERFQRASRVSEGWIRDFYALRGNLAHGKSADRYPSVWSVREHLLLSAFLFPLIARGVIAGHGMYVFSASDRADMELFEKLACERHFDHRVTPGGSNHPWSRVRNPLKMAIQQLRINLSGSQKAPPTS